MQKNKLNRFLEAQADNYSEALSEIKAGRKRTHWMWYVFPQLTALGHSDTAKFYGIKDKEEALVFLAHEILGQRLKEISAELLRLESNDADHIFGQPDNMKLKSSMTLFAQVSESEENVFTRVLDKFFDAERDEKTIEILKD